MIIENFKDDKDALRAMTGELVRHMDRKDDGLPFNLALSGGGTAQKMFALWVDEYKDEIDWDAIRFFWVDERCVPPTDPDSNYGHANELLFKPLHIPADHVHRIHGEVEPGTDALFACREGVSAPARAIALFRLYHPGYRRRCAYRVDLPRYFAAIDGQP